MYRLPDHAADARLDERIERPISSEDADEARRLAKASKSAATWDAYERDLRDFRAFCDEHGRIALPATPDTVCAYLASRSRGGAAAATLDRRLSAIAQLHKAKELPNPVSAAVVRAIMKGIRRERGYPFDQPRRLTDLT